MALASVTVSAPGWVASLHLSVTAALAGLIWVIQVVHYPLFAAVGPDRFVAYEQRHRMRISAVVGPLMAIEGLTALALVAAPPAGRALPIAGLALLGAIHASTVFLQVPLHTRLSERYDDAAVARLVRTNWIRTAGWTLRTVVATVIVSTA
jgi:hypothetical protein